MELYGLRVLGHTDLGGRGDGMQLMTRGSHLYVGHSKPGHGASIVDISDPRSPKLIGRLPDYEGTYSPKVQIAGDIMLVNYEQRRQLTAARTGFSVYDISRPDQPREISFTSVPDRGVHRMWWTGGRYAYMSAIPEGFRERMLIVVDLVNLGRPELVSRWWLPGTKDDEPCDWPTGRKNIVHHPVVHENRAYLGCWDDGLRILDISAPFEPREISALSWPASDSGHTHTAMPLPGRQLLLVVDEAADDDKGVPKHVRVVDISDELNPKEISKFPVPEGDFRSRGLRFGPHNLHEHRPGAFVSENLIFVTYYNAGLRVVDMADPAHPREVAWFIPPTGPGQPSCQTNDVYVTEQGVIYISDRVDGGVWALAMD